MKETKNTIWSYDFTILFFSTCIAYLGQFMMSTLLPKYLSHMELPSTVVGVVISMFSVTALGSRPFIGPLIDGYNKSKLFRIALGFMLLSFFGYIVSKSVVLLCVFRLTHGIGLGCFAALALTMVSEAVPPEKLASGIGVYGLSSVLATAAGPGIGLAIVERFSYQAAFLFSATLLIIAMLLSLRMKPKNDREYKVVFRMNNIISRQALVPAFIMFMACMARAGITTFLVVLITDVRDIGGISTYYVINAVAMAASRPLMGKISDKKGLHITLMISFVLFALNLVAVAFCHSTPVLYLAAVLNAFGFGATQPAAQALGLKLAGENNRGAASNTVFIGIDLGDLLGPILCGALVDLFNYEVMFLTSILPVAVSVFVLLFWVKRNREKLA